MSALPPNRRPHPWCARGAGGRSWCRGVWCRLGPVEQRRHPDADAHGFLPVDFPGDLSGKRKPYLAVMPIVGETAAPRSWQDWCRSRTRPIGRKGTGNPPVAVEAERDFDRSLSHAGAHGQPVGTVVTPAQRGVEQNSVGRPGKFGKVSHQLAAHQRRRVLGVGERNDAERHDVKPSLAALQRIAR